MWLRAKILGMFLVLEATYWSFPVKFHDIWNFLLNVSERKAFYNHKTKGVKHEQIMNLVEGWTVIIA